MNLNFPIEFNRCGISIHIQKSKFQSISTLNISNEGDYKDQNNQTKKKAQKKARREADCSSLLTAVGRKNTITQKIKIAKTIITSEVKNNKKMILLSYCNSNKHYTNSGCV